MLTEHIPLYSTLEHKCLQTLHTVLQYWRTQMPADLTYGSTILENTNACRPYIQLYNTGEHKCLQTLHTALQYWRTQMPAEHTCSLQNCGTHSHKTCVPLCSILPHNAYRTWNLLLPCSSTNKHRHNSSTIKCLCRMVTCLEYKNVEVAGG